MDIDRLVEALPIELSIRLCSYQALEERIGRQDRNCTVKTIGGVAECNVEVKLNATLFGFQNSNQKSQVDTHGLTPMALE